MRLLYHILRKFSGGYKLLKLLDNNQPSNAHGGYNIISQKWKKDLETLIQAMNIYSDDTGMDFGIKICAGLMRKSGKRQMTEGIGLSNQYARRKNNVQILVVIRGRLHKTRRKLPKNDKTTRKQTLKQKSRQRNKYPGYPQREKLGAIANVG